MKLTDTQIKNAKPGEKPIKLADGKGLTLVIQPTGSKIWRLRYRRNGKETQMSLGDYPTVSLKRAREKAQEARLQRIEGQDPIATRRRDQVRAKTVAGDTFFDVAEAYQKGKTRWSEGHASRFRNRMERDVYPVLGRVKISEIEAIDVLAAVQPIAERGAIDTAKRVLAMIGQVFVKGIALGLCKGNPSAGLTAALEDTPPVEHRPAIIEPDALGDFLNDLWEWETPSLSKPLLKLCMLTVQRPGEVRKMEWADVDFEAREWTHYVTKTKTEGHIVPLSDQALEVLEEMRELTGPQTKNPAKSNAPQWVFYNAVYDQPVSNVATSQALDHLGYKGQMSAHGMRATFRTHTVETLGHEVAPVEMQLAHVVRDPLGASYNRTTWREERHIIMQEWADWVDAQRRRGRAKKLKIGSVK